MYIPHSVIPLTVRYIGDSMTHATIAVTALEYACTPGVFKYPFPVLQQCSSHMGYEPQTASTLTVALPAAGVLIAFGNENSVRTQ